MRATPLYTIGYEGASLNDFLTTLVISDVARVIDIREVPISRKRGFSKRALADALAARGIAYVHLKQLGTRSRGEKRPAVGSSVRLDRSIASI